VNNWYKIGIPVLLVLSLLVSVIAITVAITKEGPAPQLALAASSQNSQAYGQPDYVAAGCRGIGTGVGFSGSCRGLASQTTGYVGGASCH
jgi:hypothetical protein